MRVFYCTAAAFALFVGIALLSAGLERLDTLARDITRLAVGAAAAIIGLGTLVVILWV